MTDMVKRAPWLAAVLALFPGATALAANPGNNAPVAVSERRWTLEGGLADARHPDWRFPVGPMPSGARYDTQSVRAPHEGWALAAHLSFRLPGRAGRLTGAAILENIGDGISNGSQGVAVPFEAPDGTRGTLSVYANPSIEPKWSYSLSWSRTLFRRGSYAVQHELGFVSRRLHYGFNASYGSGHSETSLVGLRLGLVATRRLAHGAALDVVAGCAAARRSERFEPWIPSYADETWPQSTNETERSWRALPDVTLRLRLPLARRLEGTLGYRWEKFGRTRVGNAASQGAFVTLTLGIGS